MSSVSLLCPLSVQHRRDRGEIRGRSGHAVQFYLTLILYVRDVETEAKKKKGEGEKE